MNNNGHEYVDLGLPSGTKWATCNVGADKPEDPGLLFQFGRVDGYKYDDKNHKFSTLKENKTTFVSEYSVGQILSLSDDIARANMGGDWIMPTKEDLKELYDNTTHEVAAINGKKGILFTSNINGKSIFIVFAGCWGYDNSKFYGSGSYGFLRSSEVRSSDDNTAWCLEFYSGGRCGIYYSPRVDGYSVRGVLK